MLPPRRKKLLIDCDPGTDDAIALLMAIGECARRDHEILAITTTYGNVPLEQTSKNTAKVLDTSCDDNEYFDSKMIPIFAGSEGPILTNNRAYYPWHGQDGLGDAGLPDSSRQIETEHASLAMIRLVKENPGEVSLICLGPLTNLALACRLDPTLPHHVHELVWMGGCANSKGNVTLTAEFNVSNDPEAAHVVLGCFPRSTMVSWEVTETHAVPWRVFDDFLAKAALTPHSKGQFITAISKPFLRDRHKWEGAVICDAVAVAVALEPGIVKSSFTKFVDVELGGIYTRGQTVVDWEGRLGKLANVCIIDEIDNNAFHEMVLRILEA